MALSQRARSVFALINRMSASTTTAKARHAHKLFERRLLDSKKRSRSFAIPIILQRRQLSCTIHGCSRRRAVRQARLGRRAVFLDMPEVTVTILMLLRPLTRLGEHRARVALGSQLLPRPIVASVSVSSRVGFNSSVLISELRWKIRWAHRERLSYLHE